MTARGDSFAGIYAQYTNKSFTATPEQRHRAMVAVCAAARDAEDARMLLGTLGLLEEEPAHA